jgi:hypothetical protein
MDFNKSAEEKMRIIQYAIDLDTGLVISRVGSEFAWPILDYPNIRPENDYTMNCYLEKIQVSRIAGCYWLELKWTKKISKRIKNTHREFWGFPKLK